MVYKRNNKRRYNRRKQPLKKTIKSIVLKNEETKRITNFSQIQYGIGYITGYLVDLTALSQGYTEGTRVANHVNLTKILGRLVFNMDDNSVTQAWDVFRCIIVQSKGGQLTTSDMPTVYGPANLDKMNVLYDRIDSVSNLFNSAGVATDRSGSNHVTYNIKLRSKFKRNIDYRDGTVNSYTSPIYIFMLCELGGVKVSGWLTTYYKDA